MPASHIEEAEQARNGFGEALKRLARGGGKKRFRGRLSLPLWTFQQPHSPIHIRNLIPQTMTHARLQRTAAAGHGCRTENGCAPPN